MSLFGNDIAHGIENEDAKTVIVPIKEKENVETIQPVYALFNAPNFDGEQIYKDVSEKIASVVEEFSSKVPEKLAESPLERANVTTLTSMYSYLPNLKLDSLPLTNMYNALPNMNLNTVYDSMNAIDFTPLRSATSDLVAILPMVAVLGFYGLALYFVVSLLFRVRQIFYPITYDIIYNIIDESAIKTLLRITSYFNI